MSYIEQSRDHQFEPPNLSAPTKAHPGSLEKVRVMAERYRAGQPLHDPNDVTCLDRRRIETIYRRFTSLPR
jgi:hypothetical protein